MTTKFRANQSVYCLLYGKGYVTKVIDDKEDCFPVRVTFPNPDGSDIHEAYTLEGKARTAHKNRCLFTAEEGEIHNVFLLYPPKCDEDTTKKNVVSIEVDLDKVYNELDFPSIIEEAWKETVQHFTGQKPVTIDNPFLDKEFFEKVVDYIEEDKESVYRKCCFGVHHDVFKTPPTKAGRVLNPFLMGVNSSTDDALDFLTYLNPRGGKTQRMNDELKRTGVHTLPKEVNVNNLTILSKGNSYVEAVEAYANGHVISRVDEQFRGDSTPFYMFPGNFPLLHASRNTESTSIMISRVQREDKESNNWTIYKK